MRACVICACVCLGCEASLNEGEYIILTVMRTVLSVLKIFVVFFPTGEERTSGVVVSNFGVVDVQYRRDFWL